MSSQAVTSPTDPNNVLMTGENSFIRFSPDGGKTQTDRASHWRVLWCPAGAGHALFLKTTLTGGEAKIWSDRGAGRRNSARLGRFPFALRPHHAAGLWRTADRRVQHVLSRKSGAHIS